MTPSLQRWIGDADALRLLHHFRLEDQRPDLEHIKSRTDDYYISLVGDLFEAFHREDYQDSDWARLGNALVQFAVTDREGLQAPGVSHGEARLFAATAFYCGGFPASAYLTAQGRLDAGEGGETALACEELLQRPSEVRSQTVRELLDGVRLGETDRLDAVYEAASRSATAALSAGPGAWIPARLLERLLARFRVSNVRAVLPDGNSAFWTPLVASLLERRAWEFFPSQIGAISGGLLDGTESCALQMPTGSGKTALCETLLYRHARTTHGRAAVLIVPYRALASELRETLVSRLNRMGVSARCVYGGSVPTADEARGLDELQVLVATPEALSGVLNADAAFFNRVSLAVCDEGHLLDGGARGVALELLLARMRGRADGGPRLVFMSAIVPNIEEINVWLGGTAESVIRSDYRPSVAEFAVLRPQRRGRERSVSLVLHPHEDIPTQVTLEQFLVPRDFAWWNARTRRYNTYSFQSINVQAIAAARKALPMGTAAVFASNKRGTQGAIGLAEELLEQVSIGLPLPLPSAFADANRTEPVVEYLEREFGPDWVAARALRSGVVVHHGDISQEAREVLEGLVRHGSVRCVICTSTLAEGVNFPIRTLVLYSVQRRGRAGETEHLLARDIKNLVGRAGRAGATTKALVVCANPDQWRFVEPVARMAPGEPVIGALRRLMEGLLRALAVRGLQLSNQILEGSPQLHTLVDGIDATLVDLVTDELGEETVIRMATELADRTFASRQAAQQTSRQLLRQVFSLRARRVLELRTSGELAQVRVSGAKVRLVDSVRDELLPSVRDWREFTVPVSDELVATMVDWAWRRPELRAVVRQEYRLDDQVDVDIVKGRFAAQVTAWLAGASHREIAQRQQTPVDDVLGLQAQAIGFVLQALVEQAVPLLATFLSGRGIELPDPVLRLPEHLRYGVPSECGCTLSAHGLRHRSAAVQLGNALTAGGVPNEWESVRVAARALLDDDAEQWRARLGDLVFRRTLQDLA